MDKFNATTLVLFHWRYFYCWTRKHLPKDLMLVGELQMKNLVPINMWGQKYLSVFKREVGTGSLLYRQLSCLPTERFLKDRDGI